MLPCAVRTSARRRVPRCGRGSSSHAAAALSRYRRLAFIEAPGTLDGGDVLVMPGRVFVGDTPRTNAAGARQLSKDQRIAYYDEPQEHRLVSGTRGDHEVAGRLMRREAGRIR